MDSYNIVWALPKPLQKLVWDVRSYDSCALPAKQFKDLAWMTIEVQLQIAQQLGWYHSIFFG